MTYEAAREPSPEDWAIRSKFLELGRSVPKTAYALGIERSAVIRAVMIVRWWNQDSGYDARFAKAKAAGFSDADARLHAEQVADFYRRTHE